MKKILFLVFAVSLIGAACNKTPEPETVPNPTPPPPVSTIPTTQVYKYEPFDFEASYPPSFSFTQPTYANLENKIVQFSLGQEAYPNTNFVDGAVSISEATSTSEANCKTLSKPENLQPFSKSVLINSTSFFQTTASGAAAGNLYQSNVYRTYKNNQCFEIVETIHTGNIGNYPEGTVTEVNKRDVYMQLNEITQSFKFNS